MSCDELASLCTRCNSGENSPELDASFKTFIEKLHKEALSPSTPEQPTADKASVVFSGKALRLAGLINKKWEKHDAKTANEPKKQEHP